MRRIDDRGDAVKAEAVDAEFDHPISQIAKQELHNLWLFVVEKPGSSDGICGLGCSEVVIRQSICCKGSTLMGWRHVDTKACFVRLMYKVLKIFRLSQARCRGKISAWLCTHVGVVPALLNPQQQQCCVAIPFGTRDDNLRSFSIALRMAWPSSQSQVALVNSLTGSWLWNTSDVCGSLNRGDNSIVHVHVTGVCHSICPGWDIPARTLVFPLHIDLVFLPFEQRTCLRSHNLASPEVSVRLLREGSCFGVPTIEVTD
mmetsp:Transcript_60011/g.106800  ORF Transcript_60011/g.106800 Transcript_60011/m.106800 type:complete len:258 (+) Transcript_60011:1342-2115(+)